jgi:hypothetical protein
MALRKVAARATDRTVNTGHSEHTGVRAQGKATEPSARTQTNARDGGVS